MEIRIGIVGASKTNNGIGEYVAKYFHNNGIKVLGVVNNSYSSSKFACENLKKKFNIDANPYENITELVGGEQIDALAICSPAVTHKTFLEQALNYGLHVFCEKPLIWHPTNPFIDDAKTVIAEFTLRNLILHENTLWTYTLCDFEKLNNKLNNIDIQDICIQLSPAENDLIFMLREAVPHANSLILNLKLNSIINDIKFLRNENTLDIFYTTINSNGNPVNVNYKFKWEKYQPRSASYSINGMRLERIINMQNYSFFFSNGEKKIKAQDPLEKSVINFKKKIVLIRENKFDNNNNEDYYYKILQNLKMLYYFKIKFGHGENI